MMDEMNAYSTVPQEEDYFGDVEFMLYTYKVERCMISQPHAWKNCPFVHHQEPIKRRHPTQHMAHLCPLVKKGQTCTDDKCCWAHNAFELWLHPERYKTIMCRKGAACGRGICFFAHSEAELRVPTKAKALDLSNPAAAAGAVGAALKFKAVAQALPNAAISAAPVSAKRSPVSLQVPAAQHQLSLGVPSMSLGVPAMSLGFASMSLGVPSMSLGLPASSVPMSSGVAALPGVLAIPAVPEHMNLAAMGQGIAGCSPMPVHMDLRYMNGSESSCQNLQHMPSWANSASTASAAASNSIGSSSHSQNSHSHCSSSSSTRLDAGDYLLSDAYACSNTANGTAAAAPLAFTQQQHNGFPAVMHTGMAGPALNGYAVPPQQQQQPQPVLLDLFQAAAAVRAEVEKGVGADADQKAALQAAADRVAALLFTGPFGGLCGGVDGYPAWHSSAVHDSARKRRSLNLPTGDPTLAAIQQQQQLLRSGSA